MVGEKGGTVVPGAGRSLRSATRRRWPLVRGGKTLNPTPTEEKKRNIRGPEQSRGQRRGISLMAPGSSQEGGLQNTRHEEKDACRNRIMER